MDSGAKKLAALAAGMILFGSGFLAYLNFKGTREISARLPASSSYKVLRPSDLPAQIETIVSGDRILALRQPASRNNLSPAFAEATRFVKDSPWLASQSAFKATDKRPLRIISPILAHEGTGSSALSASLPIEMGDLYDPSGIPLRWHSPSHAMSVFGSPKRLPFKMPVESRQQSRFEKALAGLRPSGSASDYRAIVESFAGRYNLNANLVMAIIHSESNFSPRLVSSKSAMGLMQLLPSTASDEVHRFLYGRRGQINFEQLAVPEINIRYGTAYLHILNNRYFANVQNPQVREACVIASYNMGPNGFLRLYGARPELAIQKINSMTPEEFHADLPKRLPMRETRFYVEKVRRMKQFYAGSR